MKIPRILKFTSKKGFQVKKTSFILPDMIKNFNILKLEQFS